MKNTTQTTLSLICLLLFTACHKTEQRPITYHANGEVETLYKNNPGGINIVILGDGYIKNDLQKGGAYDQQVKDLMDYFFTVPPFKQYKQYFNTYVVYAESASRDAAIGFDPGNKKTKFNAFFDSPIGRALQAGALDSTYTYVEKALPLEKVHLVIMLVNDDTYGGTGGSIAVVSSSQFAKYVLVHEVGHTFALLGDEYVEDAVADGHPADIVNYLPNIDDTNDPAKTKWAHFFSTPAYKGIVGSYEGAYYRPVGFYRPEQTSLMGNLNCVTFNAPSREAIVRRIHEILNIPFDVGQFLKDDAASIKPVLIPLNGQAITPPKNDLINIKQRIDQLYKKKVN